MSHCPQQDRLLDLLHGGAADTPMRGIIEHIPSCPDCQDTLVALRLLVQPEEIAEADHPAAERLVALALGEVSSSENHALGDHLRGCTDCTEAVKAVRNAETTPAAEPRSPGSARRHGVSWPVAAMLAAGMSLASVIAFQVFQNRHSENAVLSTGDGHVTPLRILRAPLRGEADLPEFDLLPAEVGLSLAVETRVDTAEIGEGDALEIVLARVDDGRIIWRRTISSESASRSLQMSGVLLVFLPRSVLEDGEMELRVLAGPESKALDRFSFVVRASAAD